LILIFLQLKFSTNLIYKNQLSSLNVNTSNLKIFSEKKNYEK